MEEYITRVETVKAIKYPGCYDEYILNIFEHEPYIKMLLYYKILFYYTDIYGNTDLFIRDDESDKNICVSVGDYIVLDNNTGKLSKMSSFEFERIYEKKED